MNSGVHQFCQKLFRQYYQAFTITWVYATNRRIEQAFLMCQFLIYFCSLSHEIKFTDGENGCCSIEISGLVPIWAAVNMAQLFKRATFKNEQFSHSQIEYFRYWWWCKNHFSFFLYFFVHFWVYSWIGDSLIGNSFF